MARFEFQPYGLRTDGRQFRPHAPWRLNTGQETANRTTAPGVQYPRTDFSQALRPRLGGLMQPQMDFRTDAQKSADNPAGSAIGNALLDAGSSTEATPQTPQIAVPSDTPPISFGEVSDTAAANMAEPTPAPTPSSVQDGWVTTGSQEAQSIASRYSPLNQPMAFNTSPVGVSNLPY